MCRNIEGGIFRASLRGTHFFYLEDSMFISLSKTIERFGGFRVGFRMRLNKKNAIWFSLIIMFIGIFKLMWYMMILCGWMMYAICFGLYWCIKKLISVLLKKHNNQRNQNIKGNDIIK